MNKEDLGKKFNIKINNNVFTCNVCGYSWKSRIRYDRNLSCPNCHPYEHGSSRGECELYDILSTTGLKIIHNDRNILSGKELDLYFPELKLAIEYDGKYWHNKEKDELKNQLCKSLGIYLIRIDNDDFIANRNKIINNLIYFINSKYNLNLKIDLSKVKEIIRYSGKCRKIICTDTMEIYDSYLDLKNKHPAYNIRNILNVCSGRFSNYKGFHFKYYDENTIYNKTIPGYEYDYKHVKCIETNEVFPSLNSILNYISTIWDCLSGRQKTAYGLHWKYTEEESTEINKTLELLKNYSITKKVICLNTGIIYSSIKEASRKLNIYEDGISRCCLGSISQTHGLKFQYLNESHKFISKLKLEQIQCIETGKIYNGIKEVMKDFNAPSMQVISRVLSGKRKSYKGFHFKRVKNV